jgi:hypothetical protein
MTGEMIYRVGIRIGKLAELLRRSYVGFDACIALRRGFARKYLGANLLPTGQKFPTELSA